MLVSLWSYLISHQTYNTYLHRIIEGSFLFFLATIIIINVCLTFNNTSFHRHCQRVWHWLPAFPWRPLPHGWLCRRTEHCRSHAALPWPARPAVWAGPDPQGCELPVYFACCYLLYFLLYFYLFFVLHALLACFVFLLVLLSCLLVLFDCFYILLLVSFVQLLVVVVYSF